jgi:hypothetical protein
MGIYSNSTSAYLAQTVVPDNTADWSIFVWLQNPAPAIVLPDYRIGLMLLEGTDYTDEFLGIRFEQIDGAQQVFLTGSGGDAASYPVGEGHWLPFVIRYDSGTTTASLSLKVTSGWVTVGSLVRDLSGITWASANLLADTIGGIGGMLVSFYRLWNGLILTEQQATSENESAVARLAGVTIDTPLQTVLDVKDVSGAGNNWTITGAPADAWPGPLGGDLGLVLVTERETEGRWLGQRQMAMLENVELPTGSAGSGSFVLIGTVPT